MKKKYMKPEQDVVKIKYQVQLLTVSGIPKDDEEEVEDGW
jgi:hypothetical protein